MATASRDVLFIIDPLESLNPKADSSYVMILEGLAREHTLYAADTKDLLLVGEDAFVRCRRVTASRHLLGGPAKPIFRDDTYEVFPLARFAAVMMRKDPPFDENYLTATWILDRARGKTLLINDPQGLRDLNEKLTALLFPEYTPRTCMLRSKQDILHALDDFGGKMILKPVFGFGGREVVIVRREDPNLHTLIELATREETRWTIAQAFLPEAAQGDKRILLVEGEPIGAVLRVPQPGELRGNLHVGGTPNLTELSARDLEICQKVGALLREKGQFLAGIDVIGGQLTEVNVTSPTGMQEINRLRGLEGASTMQAQFWNAVEARLTS